MRRLFLFSLLAVLGTAFFLIFVPYEVEVLPMQKQESRVNEQGPILLPSLPEPTRPASDGSRRGIVVSNIPKNQFTDIEKQRPLPNPPEVIKGIYVTAWVAGSPSRMSRIIDLIKRTELNAVVIDIKDFSGYVSYKTGIPEVAASGAEGEIRIFQPNALIKRLHDEGIYVIARQIVFQDPVLAKARPEWALKNASSGAIWADHKGLQWMDPAAKPVWDYNIAIAKDAASRGFDEINFDYIRFASDGDLSKIAYPFWQKTRTGAERTRADAETKRDVIRNFFKYLRESLPGVKISADLFGLSTVNRNDLGIGQVIEDAYAYFDYVSPMVYPSHYAKGFLGYQNPAEHPYEVVKYSLDQALARLITMTNNYDNYISSSTASSSKVISHSTSPSAKLRPWLQDFDLGANYDAQKVRAQIQAVYDVFSASSTNHQSLTTNDYFNGWLLWNPENTYTEEALEQ